MPALPANQASRPGPAHHKDGHGFHHSVLGDFRERLLEEEEEESGRTGCWTWRWPG